MAHIVSSKALLTGTMHNFHFEISCGIENILCRVHSFFIALISVDYIKDMHASMPFILPTRLQCIHTIIYC